MLLSSLAAPGQQPDPIAVHNAVPGVYDRMYANGWTVIGSQFKTPKLHPWKGVPREELFNLAHKNYRCMKANSINIRLADTSTMAFDCDFHDEWLMEEFLARVKAYMVLKDSDVWTCTGGKGGKVFFTLRHLKGTKTPRRLGPDAWDLQAPPGRRKNELEIKTDLSTVAGFHSPINGDQGYAVDYVLYGPMPGTGFIADARPDQLPIITLRDINGLESIYLNLLACRAAFNTDGCGYTDREGKELHVPGYRAKLISAVAAFMAWACITMDSHGRVHGLLPDMSYAYPRFHALWLLGMAPAMDVIAHLFYSHPVKSEWTRRLCADAVLQIAGLNQYELERRAQLCTSCFEWHEQIIMERLIRMGLKTIEREGLETLSYCRIMSYRGLTS